LVPVLCGLFCVFGVGFGVGLRVYGLGGGGYRAKPDYVRKSARRLRHDLILDRRSTSWHCCRQWSGATFCRKRLTRREVPDAPPTIVIYELGERPPEPATTLLDTPVK